MVTAKFRCISMKKYENNIWQAGKFAGTGFTYAYEFQAVTGGSEENESFFASTPTGQLTLGAVREDLFVPGQSYYLNFEEAQIPGLSVVHSEGTAQ